MMKLDLLQYRFGVNYTPSRNWWHCWNDFCPDSIARDFDSIVRLGADHLRLPLIWPYFQPDPGVVSQAHLDRLDIVMRLAGERGLDVNVSMLVGWMSGYAFRTFFERNESLYTSERLWSAQELYFSRVADVMRSHANFLGFDSGNELNCCWKAESLEIGDAWHHRIMGLMYKLLPDHVHTNGVDHQPWFFPNTFSPRTLARTPHVTAIHPYAHFTGALRETNGDAFGPASIKLLAAFAALVRSYAGDPAKPVWVQECGMCSEWTEEARIPLFLEQTILNGIEGGVAWFTWWCSHDIDAAYTFDKLEYTLGLITLDQKIKPQGEAFRRVAEAYRGRRMDQSALAGSPPRKAPETFSHEGTWKWLREWLRESGEQKNVASA